MDTLVGTGEFLLEVMNFTRVTAKKYPIRKARCRKELADIKILL